MTSTKTLVYVLLVISAAFIIYLITATPQSFWVIWSAFLFCLISLGQTFSRRVGLIALTAIAASFAAFIAGICAYSIIALALYLFLLTGVSILFVETYPEYSLLAFIVPIFGILGGNISSSFAAHLMKLLFILSGGAIVIMAQLIFFYKFRVNESHRLMALAIDHLKSLSNEIFACFQVAYTDNVYLFERRIHLQKMNFMRATHKIREYKYDTTSLENIYDILLDCSQLRNRISDPTILSLCTEEMEDLVSEINELFMQLKRALDNQTTIHFNTELLTQKIMRFDEIYHNVLAVTSKEPSVFLIFITSIKKLEEAMQRLYAGLHANEFS